VDASRVPLPYVHCEPELQRYQAELARAHVVVEKVAEKATFAFCTTETDLGLVRRASTTDKVAALSIGRGA
jgi:hypothetical protein